jgi:hypothetical protein
LRRNVEKKFGEEEEEGDEPALEVLTWPSELTMPEQSMQREAAGFTFFLFQ